MPANDRLLREREVLAELRAASDRLDFANNIRALSSPTPPDTVSVNGQFRCDKCGNVQQVVTSTLVQHVDALSPEGAPPEPPLLAATAPLCVCGHYDDHHATANGPCVACECKRFKPSLPSGARPRKEERQP